MWIPLATTAVAGGLSALSNLGNRNQGLTGAAKKRQQLIEQLSGQVDGNAADTTFFQSGVGQLNQQLNRQSEQDQGQLGQFGAGGTEMAIAQSANRSRAAAHGVTNLFQGADRAQRGNRQQLISMLAQQDASEMQNRQFNENRRNQRGQLLGQSLSAFAQMYGES